MLRKIENTLHDEHFSQFKSQKISVKLYFGLIKSLKWRAKLQKKMNEGLIGLT